MSPIKFEEVIKLAKALEKMFYPFCEIYIQTIEDNKIFYPTIVEKNFEKIDWDQKSIKINLLEEIEDVSLNSYKVTKDGRVIKHLTILIRDIENTPIAYIVINYDISFLINTNKILENFLYYGNADNLKNSETEEKASLNKIRKIVENYCFKNNRNLFNLNKKDKEKLVHELKLSGIFDLKNSITLTSKILGISRATIYNYLNDKAGR